jgi:hypothetical protein
MRQQEADDSDAHRRTIGATVSHASMFGSKHSTDWRLKPESHPPIYY